MTRNRIIERLNISTNIFIEFQADISQDSDGLWNYDILEVDFYTMQYNKINDIVDDLNDISIKVNEDTKKTCDIYSHVNGLVIEYLVNNYR